MFGVLVNVGSSSLNPNGRGRIFEDGTFEYLPIPESEKTLCRAPTYRDLGFANVRFPDLAVHLDPEFETFTYGHVRRGFGDTQSLLKLTTHDVLFFYGTLQKGTAWSPYIMGYFRNLEVNDCRKLSKLEIIDFRRRGFENNAHLKRADPWVDFLIRGGKGSMPLKQAFPLAEDKDNYTLRNSLGHILLTVGGKKISPGTPWFRWTLVCGNVNALLKMINRSVCV